MVSNLYPPPRPLAIGETLDLAFRIFRATVVTCLLFAGLAVIASELPTIYNLVNHRVPVSLKSERDPIFWLLYVTGSVVALVLWSAILLRQFAVITGRVPDAGGELATALRRLPAQVLMGILTALAVMVWFILAAPFSRTGMVGLGLVFLVLSIPATYVAVKLSCAWPALLLTGRGPATSLEHSWRLVTGSWWRLTAIYTVGLILLMVLYMLAGVVVLVVAIPFAHGDLAVTTAISAVVMVMLSALGTPFYTALLLAVYGDLAVRREGADLAQRIAAAG
jgi:hypothetical protein